jgi:glycosyltransferase involved in cell wall biosynthesis
LKKTILLFADKLPPFIGGMEVHGAYFIEYFKDHPDFRLDGIITKDEKNHDCISLDNRLIPIDIKNLGHLFDPSFIFFNSGRWIEEIPEIRKLFPKAFFIYRTGGNEIIKAPLSKKVISDHRLRQAYWAQTLNSFIDLLITNSDYTEERLRNIGITCPFIKCVGGVNTSALRSHKNPTYETPRIVFCGARFVPYKNHILLISVIHALILRGHHLELHLAGDGPLLEEVKKTLENRGLTSYIKFLGALSNQETCRKIANAHIYMQLSTDQITEVPGGSYIHSEGMGRSILEALTAGTFVIAGKGGALGEVITPDRGMLVDVHAPLEVLVNQIDAIFKNFPPRPTFLEKYCWSHIFKLYEKIFGKTYEDFISNRKI